MNLPAQGAGYLVGVTLFTRFGLQGNYLTVGFATVQSKRNIIEPPQGFLAERRVPGYQTPLRIKCRWLFCFYIVTIVIMRIKMNCHIIL
jgi:hypothetical protein